MSEQRKLRPLAEGILIVVSILLAFGLEASWSSRGERQEADPHRSYEHDNPRGRLPLIYWPSPHLVRILGA